GWKRTSLQFAERAIGQRCWGLQRPWSPEAWSREVGSVMRHYKAALIQMSSRIGDKAGNVERACVFIEEAAERGAKLIALPEMFNTGYFSHTDHVDPTFWDLAEPLNGSPTLER